MYLKVKISLSLTLTLYLWFVGNPKKDSLTKILLVLIGDIDVYHLHKEDNFIQNFLTSQLFVIYDKELSIL